MTYQSPFDCMNDCAQGRCKNATTGCQWQCELRKENGQTMNGLPVVEMAFVSVRAANIAQDRASIAAPAQERKTIGLPKEALAWIENSAEPAPSLCADIRKALTTAQPADKPEGKAEQQAEPAFLDRVIAMQSRMIVCPKCGNKRCPKANDHRNECTGSNESGQPGSAYPARQPAQPQQLSDAVANLIKVKGRHHTEQAYQRLVDAYDALLAAQGGGK
jgi:hypothetical protein